MVASWRDLGRILKTLNYGERIGWIWPIPRQLRRRGRSRLTSARMARPLFEALENRRMLAVLPVPTVAGQIDISQAGDGINDNTPSIAYNPNNPLQLVTAYTRNGGNPNQGQTVFLNGSYSVNGGADWTSFSVPLNQIDPVNSTPNNAVRFAFATDAMVAFDRNDNFYIVYSQRAEDDSAGNIVLQKYDFSGTEPTLSPTVTNKVLYRWVEEDQAYYPAIAVNSNLESFTDPDTMDVQEDQTILGGQGNIYVAWSTDYELPPGPGNPNSIKLVTSADGGETFSTEVYVNDGANTGNVRTSGPQLVVSQGTLDGRVEGGQLGIFWSRFNAPNNNNQIQFDRVVGGGSGAFFEGATGGIDDATSPDGDPHVPGVTNFNVLVDVTDPDFVVADLDVELTLAHDDLSQLLITLTAPDGTVITLLRNQTDANGDTDDNVGVTGADLGIFNGFNVGTIFDSQAPRNIRDGAAPFAGRFQPELGTLTVFNGLTPAEINGTWILTVSDQRAETDPPEQEVLNWGLRFTSGLTTEADVDVAVTPIRGNVTGAFPLLADVSPDLGIGPGLSAASDNTLGAFSPFQGRLYLAYTGRQPNNPADNTDIFLVSSDDGGLTWSAPTRVNSDSAILDGFSEAGGTTGRPQFQPSVAVDQSTGTVVLSWLDARHDAARARVATYLTTSIDGGVTFSPQIYANEPNRVLDAITGTTVDLGPIPANQSDGFGGRDMEFGFGTRQGLAAVEGRIHPVWANNRNGGDLHIFTATVTTAKGPRIVSSTMGPVSQPGDFDNPAADDGTPQATGIVIVFDRPIDPETFDETSVTVIYRNTQTPGSDPGEAVVVASVTPLDLDLFGPAMIEGATTFRIDFEEPQTGTGTYSYSIAPNAQDRVRSVGTIVTPVATTTYDAEGDQIDLPFPPAGTGGSGDPDDDVTLSVISITDAPAGEVISDVNVVVNLVHTFTGDLIITLIAPDGTRILLANQRGSSGEDFDNTVFDDQAALPISAGFAPFAGSFRPESPLRALFGKDPNGDWTLEINDAVAIDTGVLLGWSLVIETGTVEVGTISGNLMDQNADGFGGQSAEPGFALGDVYAIPRPLGLFSAAPFDLTTLPLIVPGPHVVGTSIDGQPVSADNLVLNGIADSIDVVFDRDMDPATITPASILRMEGPVGLISGPQRYVSADGILAIPDVPVGTPFLPTLTSRIEIVDDYLIGDLDVRLSITHNRLSDLQVVLISPSGTRVPLIMNVPALGPNFANTLLDDAAPSSITDGTAPFSRRVGFRPSSPLSALNEENINGIWQLEVVDIAAGVAGTLDGWSIIAAPSESSFSVTPDPFETDPNPDFPRTYRFHFPTQRLSGTYLLTLDSAIRSAAGEALDTNLNAGLDLLRGTSSDADTIPLTFESSNVPQPVGDVLAADKITTSIITVDESFLIQSMTVQVNITHPFVPDLEATLIAPDGTEIRLFTNVGNTGTRANFIDTVFDDALTDSNGRSIPPIQNGAAPFFGRFHPQQPLSVLNGTNAAGTWTLRIRNTAAGSVGTLNAWSLTFQKPVPPSGLGEAVADQKTVSFRIFTMDPTNPQSHNTWTAVGGASLSGNSGRIGGLAVDPSDPTGNTIYVAGASGGIWKTGNFLTTDPSGPIWIPLTDFGPTFSLNMGSLAAFGRNNDPRQTIIFGATGEANAGTSGVGFIRSMDGGATWTLLDSTINVDANGNPLPIDSPLRDHIFVGTGAFKVVVDPRPSPSGEVIVYAALTGPNGGIWRSTDTGKTWKLMRAGNATDVVLDLNSGVINAISNPTGNVDIIYGAFRDEGVFISPNRGGVWNQMLGLSGRPLLRDADDMDFPEIPVTAPSDTPSGDKGRILLVTPELTGNPLQDVLYQGWVYALVVTDESNLDGLYMTKDFGQNWTKVRVASATEPAATPTNDPGFADYPIFGTRFGQGNYDASIAIDVNNPHIVYIGGKRDGTGAKVLRVDTTGLGDPYAFFISNNEADGGATRGSSGPARPSNVDPPNPFLFNPDINPMINFVRNPFAPFLANATIRVTNTAEMTNPGTGATWTQFDQVQPTSNDNQRMISFRDPLTGRTRLIFGDDHAVTTGVDVDGVYTSNIGTALLPSGVRTGNLQISQFYYGAVQPSDLAAQIAGAMFYGAAQDDGAPASTADPLSTGFIDWPNGSNRGDSAGVATDQTGSGTLYRYNWPCCGGGDTDFFQVDGIGRTFGLLQAGDDPRNDMGQWPQLGTINFAVNPINPDQIIISSQAGRIFGTSNRGVFWLEIGNPTALDSTRALALAFGAPSPTDPTGALNNFLYAGTDSGNIFVTFTGGGATGNQWMDISAGLDGSQVRAIVTNPLRGSREAYAVTARGVYHMLDSGGANPVWIDVTGNLLDIQHDAFFDFTLAEDQPQNLTSIQADWRYRILADPNNPDGPTRPILYVGGEGGVYRSLNNGGSWHLFPDDGIDGAPRPGGYLPNARVTDMDLALGNINPTTGRAVLRDPDTGAVGQNILVAHTYGRGTFAIRLAPVVIPALTRLDPASDTGQSNTDGITADPRPVFTGISAETAFGNTVRITLLDLTDPANPVYIGGFDGEVGGPTDIAENWTDTFGRFRVQVNEDGFTSDGVKVVGIRATDDSGAVGAPTRITLTLRSAAPPPPSVPALAPASDSGISNSDGITNVVRPTFIGTGDPGAVLELLLGGSVVGTTVVTPEGDYAVTLAAPLAEGDYSFTARQRDVLDNVSEESEAAMITIDTTPPASSAGPIDLLAASDTGISDTDDITSEAQPTFVGTAGPDGLVQIVANGTVVATAVADGAGDYSIALPSALADGTYTVLAREVDVAGNASAASPALTVVIDTTAPAAPSVPDLTPASDTGLSNSDDITADTTPTFVGMAEPNATVRIFAGETLLGSTTASGLGAYVFTVDTPLSQGTYEISAEQTDLAGNTSPRSAALTIVIDLTPQPAPINTVGDFIIAASEGTPTGIRTVATFTDPNTIVVLAGSSAVIDWGDGTTSAGSISFDPGTGVYTITGNHVYASPGTFTITTAINVATTSNTVLTVPVTSTANVANPAVVPQGGFSFFATSGTSTGNRVVATFTDPGGPEAVGDYSATINWGDGSSSAGVIAFDAASGVFSVAGSHTYAANGTYTITTTINHGTAPNAAPAAIATSTAQIADVVPSLLEAVKINNGLRQRSSITRIVFRIAEQNRPATLELSDLTLMRKKVQISLENAGFRYNPDNGRVVLNLRRVAIQNGDFTLFVNVGNGNTGSLSFHKLRGDANGDRSVTRRDRRIVEQAMGTREGQPGYNGNADLDSNGNVNGKDLRLVLNNLGRTLD